MGRSGSKKSKLTPTPPHGVGLKSCPIPAPPPLRGEENPLEEGRVKWDEEKLSSLHKVPVNSNFLSFFIVLCHFFQLYKMWGQLYRQKKKEDIIIGCWANFMSFSLIYSIFLLSVTYISLTLINIVQYLLTFAINHFEGKLGLTARNFIL